MHLPGQNWVLTVALEVQLVFKITFILHKELKILELGGLEEDGAPNE